MTEIPIAAPDVGAEEKRRVCSVLDSGRLTDGPEVRAFEREFADYCGVDRGVATTNGTTALHAALHAVGVGPGDTVVTSPFSFVASANAVRLCGATPAFADVDPETFNLDPDAVETLVRARSGDVDAIVVVHLYGLPAEMDRFVALAEQYDLRLVEDAAQAHGASYRGDRVGSFGDAACFSFYPTKNMTTGEGGMVVTDDAAVAQRARAFTNHGRTGQYEHATLGHNFRMTDVAAAIGRVQLEKLPAYNDRRRENARLLASLLDDVPDVVPPVEPSDRRHVYHQFTVRSPTREALRSHLEERGVDSGVYYPTPIHRQPAYAHVECDAPRAERATGEVLSLPVHPGLTADDVRTVADGVRSYASR